MTLAEDLVTAAAQAIRTAELSRFVDRPTEEGAAAYSRAAVEAVLRGVVKRLRSDGATGSSDWRDAYTQAANDLEMLADEIEGGSHGTR